MNGETRWYHAVRDIHDQHFRDAWQERADAINQRFCLTGKHKLLTHGLSIPPPWFIGDIDAVEPGRWVLVISLNHQVTPDAPYFCNRVSAPHPTADDYWDYCRLFNRDHCYRRFFGPLAQVAAAGLGEQLSPDQECGFATMQMLFTEICPYGSNTFNLGWPDIKALLHEDPGFQLAKEVNDLLIEQGSPAFILINGMGAVEMAEQLYAASLTWRELRYDPCDARGDENKPKRPRHWCGALRLTDRAVPVVGFPFLRTAKSHNSHRELAQLGIYVRQCVQDHAEMGSAGSALRFHDAR